MAAALFNIYANHEGCIGISAGTQPANQVHPEVVQVMREIGIDLSAAKPQKLTDELARSVSVLVTMGCGETCPYVPGLKRVDWEIPDPKGQPIEQVRAIRDEIHESVKALLRAECADCIVGSNCLEHESGLWQTDVSKRLDNFALFFRPETARDAR